MGIRSPRGHWSQERIGSTTCPVTRTLNAAPGAVSPAFRKDACTVSTGTRVGEPTRHDVRIVCVRGLQGSWVQRSHVG